MRATEGKIKHPDFRVHEGERTPHSSQKVGEKEDAEMVVRWPRWLGTKQSLANVTLHVLQVFDEIPTSKCCGMIHQL